MKRLPYSIAALFALLVLLLWTAPPLGAGGAEEEAGSDRGLYVAEQGRIIPPAEVDIAAYIASIDYGYPDPIGDFGLTLYSGHRQASIWGQEEILQIGIQGKRTPFEDLPVLNLCFVFDSSGSMSEKDKIQWAKQGFDLLLGRLRSQDVLSVVSFSEAAEILLPATRVADLGDREGLRRRVHEVMAKGASSLDTGLRAGYDQVLASFQPQWVNRVIFVSDGLGSSEEALELVRVYKRRQISLSTVSVGMNCDLLAMKKLAKTAAGSSRFISNLEKMEEIFSTDLDRMVVPIAYEVDIEVELAPDVAILNTWGYQHRITENRIRYFLPAVHHRDYETILIQVRTSDKQIPGKTELARVKLSYRDRAGGLHAMGPYSLSVDCADSSIAAGGISDPMVLKAGTMLHTAQALEAIGTLYFPKQQEARDSNRRLTKASWQNTEIPVETRVETILHSELLESSLLMRADKQRCLDLAEEIKKEIGNTRLRLGEDYFDEELTIARKYIEIIGGELHLGQVVVSRLLADEELQVEETGGASNTRLEDLASELALGLEGLAGGSIAVFGFGSQAGAPAALQHSAERITRSQLRGLRDFQIIREETVQAALARLELSVLSLLDNSLAFKAGSALDADYLVVGRIVAMPASVLVFAKLLDRRAATVLSVAQVILEQGD